MDTAWATSGMRFSEPNSDYDELRAQVLGSATVPWPSEPGATGGGTSPDDIARDLLAHVAAKDPGPLRLVLGEDAADQISTVLQMRHEDYAGQPGFRESSTRSAPDTPTSSGHL